MRFLGYVALGIFASGCSESSLNDSNKTFNLFIQSFLGVRQSICQAQAIGVNVQSTRSEVEFESHSELRFSNLYYSDTNCQNIFNQETAKFSYTLGSDLGDDTTQLNAELTALQVTASTAAAALVFQTNVVCGIVTWDVGISEPAQNSGCTFLTHDRIGDTFFDIVRLKNSRLQLGSPGSGNGISSGIGLNPLNRPTLPDEILVFE